ncbi:hypothetical protein [Streptomyces purpurogeneiscleroticus]|uniref:hypothetical protein n=1 Tax=Streptomyces purpurogeneiscleroticus TaxID=68259 RepID=UPI001CBC5378|nr:hypothetical protein [Streptomyces purpurogeneiscleroticus]MBZ4018929.1 hypothetical protein [Streptomyces purpurogeneiscleroticus]
MRRFMGRSVAAAVLATAVVLPASGVAQAAPKAPSVATADCKCKKKSDRWDDHGWWGHHGLLSSLLHGLL